MFNNNLKTYIDEMSEALDDEINALKEGDGGKRINLIEGEFSYKTADKYLYKFIIDTELVNIEDSPGQLIIPNINEERRVQVTVNHVDANEISLASGEDLGNYIPEAILNIAPYYLLEILKERLQEIKQKKINVNNNLLLNLFEEQVTETISDVEISKNLELNEQQYKALESSLQKDITFIWGPPGTGKTHTIGNIISNFIEQEKKVLIASHTNSAIDTALEKVADEIKDKSILYAGKIIRVGTPHKKDTALEPMLIENIIKEKSREIITEKNAIEEKIELTKSNINRLTEKIKLFSVLEDKQEVYKNAAEDIKRDENLLNNKIKNLNEFKSNLLNEENDLVKVQNANFIVRLFNRTEKEIREEIKNIKEEIDHAKRIISVIKNRINETKTGTKYLEEEMNNLKQKIKLSIGDKSKRDITDEIEILQRYCDELNKEVTKINKQIEEISSSVLKESFVIGTTLAKTSLEIDIYNMKYDVVIIDEASMAPIPNIFFTSGLSKEHLIISGDFRQLSPIAVAKTEITEKWLKKDIYFHTGIEDNIDNHGEDNRVVMLTQQYRLNDKITDVINRFYFGKLVTKNKESNGSDEKILAPFDNDILYCDTSTINPWCSRPRNSYSRYNIYNAIISVNIAEDALVKGIREVGIITPYSAQAQLVNKMIQDKGLSREIKAATVHKYQGDEKELIIVDTVDGLPYKIGKLLQGGLSSDAMRLINVAITRTKSKLVIVNNYDHFNKKLYNKDSVLNVINNVYDLATMIFPESYLSSYADVDPSKYDRKTGISITGDMIVRNEADFYQTFKEDLTKAKEKIIIISPFIAKNRLSDLMDYLRHLVDKGIEIIVLTRPAYQQPNDKEEAEEMIRMMGEFNIKVFTEKGIHQKIAFIDKKICWFGSLNILSQNKSQEEMISFRAPYTIEKLYSLLRIEFYINQERIKKERQNYQNLILKKLKNYIDIPKCPHCHKKMVLRFGKYGPFFGCSDYPSCKESVDIPSRIINTVIDNLSIECPTIDCNGHMQYRRSQRGVFLGCNNYPDCKSSINLR